MNFNEYPDREFLYLQLANRIASELGDFLRREGRATLCVPGGTTPGPVFDTLSGVDLDWANVTVFLNDERWVPEDHARSNTRLLKRRLLTGRAAAATYIPIHSDNGTPEEALEHLAEGLEPHLPISVLLLGMGVDMHTASLFPGADRLEEGLSDKAPLLLPMRAEGAGEPRITLTARPLKQAISTHLLITGPDKREALHRAEKLTPMEAPIRAFLADTTVHWAE
ncbi:6-phosphogluconolactonase [Falsirhodobacter algicola]|uniref:6-phosphogluconolactonase n=1 Tax=Falsirhodobacter algicola TaxID=2692330 RepID=A0A8J8SKJ1_9RHOB|nr:6-phosphogluconolactonase [Falsirhodobacter algicola]QUS35428.1 6-phosphogluconolactonase [Falsirhodobacter algicola]